ncbi:hypothetical protein Tco_1012315 [Tanacetum coccineum]
MSRSIGFKQWMPMQMQEEKVDMREALDAGMVVTESSGTKSDKQDTSSRSGTYNTHVVDAYIRPVNDQVPFAEVDSNTIPNSTNMSHRRGEINQDAEQYQVKSPLLNTELFKTKEMIEKEAYNELSHRFLLLEKHCILLELEIQQKYASFQSNKPGKNQDAPEFHEFFEINDLKAQLQSKTTLICNLKNQIKSVKEASNEAKVKNDIVVIETINIELEHSVAKLLAANEQLHKENEHLKHTYKELYDSIKKTRAQNKDNITYYLPKVRESGPAKPHHVNAPSSSRNSKIESYGSNDMAHTYFLEEGRKMTQDRNRIPNPRDMASARTHRTPNACTPKPRNISRCLHVSKSSCVPSVGTKITFTSPFEPRKIDKRKIKKCRERPTIFLEARLPADSELPCS